MNEGADIPVHMYGNSMQLLDCPCRRSSAFEGRSTVDLLSSGIASRECDSHMGSRVAISEFEELLVGRRSQCPRVRWRKPWRPESPPADECYSRGTESAIGDVIINESGALYGQGTDAQRSRRLDVSQLIHSESVCNRIALGSRRCRP